MAIDNKAHKALCDELGTNGYSDPVKGQVFFADILETYELAKLDKDALDLAIEAVIATVRPNIHATLVEKATQGIIPCAQIDIQTDLKLLSLRGYLYLAIKTYEAEKKSAPSMELHTALKVPDRVAHYKEQPDGISDEFLQGIMAAAYQKSPHSSSSAYSLYGCMQSIIEVLRPYLGAPKRESVSIEAAKKATGVLEWIASHDFVPDSSIEAAKEFCFKAPMMARAAYNVLRTEIEGGKP